MNRALEDAFLCICFSLLQVVTTALALFFAFFGCFFAQTTLSMIYRDHTDHVAYQALNTQVGDWGIGIVLVVSYSLMWQLIWWLNYDPVTEKVRLFKTKLLCATLPIFGYFYLYQPPLDPNMNTMNITDTHPQLIFGCLVSSVLLFPMYSYGLVRYIFKHNPTKTKWSHSLLFHGTLTVIGCIMLFVVWEAFPHLFTYKTV